MIEEFEYAGVWWIPDEPEKKIPGTLRFTHNERATLELMGIIKKKEIMSFLPYIILGVSSGGINITLHKCFMSEATFNYRGFPTFLFHFNFIFIGAHFQKSEDIKFNNISVRYLYLDEWVNITGFEKPYQDDKESVIKYKFPESINANINNDCKISIDFKQNIGPLLPVQKEMGIKQETWIKIENSEPKPFEDYKKNLYYIQSFLTLGTTEPVYLLAIEGITEINKRIIPINSDSSPYYPPVKIFYRSMNIPKAYKSLSPYNMLFTLTDISDRFETFLKNWFDKADLLEPFYNLYFGILYNPPTNPGPRFLSLIQSVESFHRRKFGGKYLEKEDYNKIYEVLTKAIPDDVVCDLKERLKGYLKYGNEFSLRKRLKEIFKEYQKILKKFIENQNAFIERVINTRNYLTHHDEELRESAANSDEITYLAERLKMLAEICLLTELGFSSEEIEKLFLRKNIFK